MNKWKIAFWVCLTALVFVMGFGFYSIIDQAYTITYMKDGCTWTENNLDLLTNVINKTDLSKTQIKKLILHDTRYDLTDLDKDTFKLNGISLIFKNNKLKTIDH